MSRKVIAVAVAFCALASSPTLAVEVGDSPTFSVQSLDGKPLSLAQYKGKLVLVDFWATWCGPCMAEADHMVQVQKKYGEKGLQIIGVSLDSNQSELRNVIKASSFNWPQFYDGGGWKNRLAVEWGVRSIPATFLIDPSGKIVWKGHPARMDAAIEKAFKETPPVLVDPALVASAAAALDFIDANLDDDALGAINKMSEVPAEASKDPGIAKRMGEAKPKLEAAAEKLLTDAEATIAKKEYLPAAAQLKAIIGAMPKSAVAGKAQKRLDELNAMPEVKAQIAAAELAARATEVLTAAQTFQAQKKDEQAYSAFKAVVKQYPTTPAAKLAAEQVKIYEKDPAFVKRANDAAAGGRAKGLLSMAQNYRAAGKSDLARAKYMEIIKEFPDTSFAATAKAEMAALK